MSKKNIPRNIKPETMQGIFAIIFFIIAIISILASLGKAGIVGDTSYILLSKLFGIGYFLIPIILSMLGVAFFRSIQTKFEFLKLIGSIIFFVSGLGIIDIIASGKSGIVGHYISLPLIKLFDVYASCFILGGLILISSLVVLDTKLNIHYLMFWRIFKKKIKDGKEEIKEVKITQGEKNQNFTQEENSTIKKDSDTQVPKRKPISDEEGDFSILSKSTFSNKKYTPPPLSLLERDSGKPEVGDIKAYANIIKRTLANFGIIVEMDEISIGPSVTRYALKPAEGVKLSKIVGLNNDLALALAAHPIRIEAPIPGKSLVGIEIPNTIKTTVGLATLLSSEEYTESEKPLLVSLGKGISGKSHFANLAKMPHLLIAGATGSGKSVTIHTVITSLLYRNSPENLKFIMIDPKRVELTLYNKIPHLLTPVITEAKKAILALKWAAKEMERRYNVLEASSVRDIESYHKNVSEPMPYIIIVIDELADIMQAYPRELESAIVRLAQMSRAVGIHLILSTQRPSVNVITGLIKANVPGRIALQVSSQIDSRTILDMSGAEKLLGAGDMLYMSGEMSKPQRIQSAFISEGEVKKVVKYLSDTYKDEIPEEINIGENITDKNSIFDANFESGDEDDLYEQAREIVIQAGKASTSYIQRKLRVGYARAARLVDMLEEKGVIGPADGAKPREVIDGSIGETFDSSSDTNETPPVV
ncbi:MAG: DNA translocase FtsK [Patescibacteria group bacterium]|nr:DNA translocase FtsK [Patescibacteria group bacterium]